jgi:hypothetical protein
MQFELDFIARPNHFVRSNLNFSLLSCVPAMVAANATTAAHYLVRASSSLLSCNDSAIKRATFWTLHSDLSAQKLKSLVGLPGKRRKPFPRLQGILLGLA